MRLDLWVSCCDLSLDLLVLTTVRSASILIFFTGFFFCLIAPYQRSDLARLKEALNNFFK